MKNKIVLISDFDGTISKKDFFYMVIDTLLKDKKDSLAPWNDYLNGKIKHIDALTGIFSQIHLTQAELDKFISTIEVDSYFYDTAKYCKDKNIPFYICSAGTNYYIKKRIFDSLHKYNITLISNDATYSQQDGMKLVAPEQNSPYYNSNTGISKQAIVQKLKNNDWWVIATDASAKDNYYNVDYCNMNSAIIMGAEHAGVSKSLLKLSDFIVKIPTMSLFYETNQ